MANKFLLGKAKSEQLVLSSFFQPFKWSQFNVLYILSDLFSNKTVNKFLPGKAKSGNQKSGCCSDHLNNMEEHCIRVF